MLLGIVLHAALSFALVPWTVTDTHQSQFFDVMFAAIHGFRMPLFFMLSGFFTAMLWRRRGLIQLLRQRAKRIALPLLLGCFTIIPAMWIVSSIVTRSNAMSPVETEIWAAIDAGDVDRVRAGLERDEIDINASHPTSGATLLSSAAFFGHDDMVRMLVEEGADVNQRNRDQGTALHTAAFMGEAECAMLLLEAGADPEVLDASSQTPKTLLTIEHGTTSFIAGQYGVEVDKEELIAGRARIAEAFGTDQYLGSKAMVASSGSLDGLAGLLFYFPVFMHLWFLWFLCWLVVMFVGYAQIARIINIQRLPKWLICSPLNLVWLVPLTMIPQLFMQRGVFGPDTSVGLLPIPSVIAYYAIFFFFGAIYWDMDDERGRLGQRWFISLPLALFIILPLAIDSVLGTFGLMSKLENPTADILLSSFLQALFAWLMITGSIGCFRQFLPHESKVLRYISDSSYWMYLVHLPLVLLAQWLVCDWNLPAFVKFAAVTLSVFAILLVTYRFGVRYTVIGKILNGPRTRQSTETAHS